MNYLGLDTGGKGAVAILSDKGDVLLLEDWPDFKEHICNDIAYLQQYFPLVVTIEKVWGRPGQGSVQTFNQGWNAGQAYMILDILCGEYDEVVPVTWQKPFDLVKHKGAKETPYQKKKKHVEKARELFPSVADSLLTSKDGRADAILIAEFGRQEHADSLCNK